MIKRVMLYIVLSLAVIFLFILLMGYIISAPKYSGPESNHFDGKNFINPGNVKAKGLYEVMRWMINRERGKWDVKSGLSYGEKPFAKVHNGIRITFVNHSTFLIQVDGVNILTDPIWSERTSPFTWAGPKRMRTPGIKFEDLPRIDYVLISHNHYDHLDAATLKRISDEHKARIITPLGVKTFLNKENINATDDMDWWDEKKLSDSISVQAVPAQHFSGRGMFDRDWVLQFVLCLP